MTDLPPDLAAFASLLDAQPEPARAVFAYCLAVAMVQDGKAQLVETRAGDASPVCMFETVAGDSFSIAKPRITKEQQEAALIDTIRDILEDEGGLRLSVSSGSAIGGGLSLVVRWSSCSCGGWQRSPSGRRECTDVGVLGRNF